MWLRLKNLLKNDKEDWAHFLSYAFCVLLIFAFCAIVALKPPLGD